MRETEKPTLKEKSQIGDIYVHPAYGAICVSRVSGGDSVLTGSDIKHQYRIRLEISEAEKHRSHHDERFFPRGKLVEIEMTEQQWASLLSSIGQGSGVPCTLKTMRKDGKWHTFPGLEFESNHTLAKEELKQAGKKITKRLQSIATEMKEKANNSGTIKKSEFKEYTARLDTILREIDSNLPFHITQHKEMMEKNIADAKADINAHVTATVQQYGLDKLEVSQSFENETIEIEDHVVGEPNE